MTVVAYCRLNGLPDQMDNPGVEAARALFRGRLTAVEQRLGGHAYMAGDVFTAADISVAYALGMGEALGAVEAFSPTVKDYLVRCRSRSAFRRALTR